MQETRTAATQHSPADVLAREVEEQMTDDERFFLVVSVMGENRVIPLARDERIPEGIPMSSGYTPGVPRLGVPALLMSDASLGVSNPGFREGDTATALPASIALGLSFNSDLARAGGRMIALRREAGDSMSSWRAASISLETCATGVTSSIFRRIRY